MNSFSLKFKLLTAFFVISLVPLVITGYLSLKKSTQFLEDSELEKINATNVFKDKAINTYFETIKNQLILMSNKTYVVSAMMDFTDSFSKLASDKNFTALEKVVAKTELTKFYEKIFAEEFKKKNPDSNLDFSSYAAQLPVEAQLAQYVFIANNPKPLGSKHEMISTTDNSSYSKFHEKHHVNFTAVLNGFGFYDIFLVDKKGTVVYSVYKEIDYATNLVEGRFSNTGLAMAYKKALQMEKGGVYLQDFNPYLPSYLAPASFVSTPLYLNNELQGVLVVQVPINKINEVVLDRTGLGEKGETYMVGPDSLLRSDTFLQNDKYNLEKSFRESLEIKSDTIDKVLASKRYVGFSTNYLGREVLTSAKELNILGLKWFLVTELPTEEAFKSVLFLKKTNLSISIATAILILVFGLFLIRKISQPIMSIVKVLFESTTKVNNVSKEVSTSSQELGQSTTEQSSAIQETVASMEQMAAMLTQTSTNSDLGLKLSEEGQKEVEKGRRVITSLISAMNEIQASNHRLESIVKAINEIKQKTQVINDIVSETRLLSFNASIEAARAGVHGKGFSVVAEEVGNLAAMSGKAAEEIRSLLENSTSEVDEIVKGTQLKVNSGIEISQNCKNVFDAMSESLQKIVNSIQMINAASKEQEAGIKQTNKAMNEMESTTEMNSRNAESLAKKSIELDESSIILKESVLSLKSIILGAKEADESKKLGQHFKTKHQNPIAKDTVGGAQLINVDFSQDTTSEESQNKDQSRWRMNG